MRRWRGAPRSHGKTRKTGGKSMKSDASQARIATCSCETGGADVRQGAPRGDAHFRPDHLSDAHLCNMACRHELSSSIVSRLCGLATRGSTCCFSLLAFLYASRRMAGATRWAGQCTPHAYKRPALLVYRSICTQTVRMHVSQRRAVVACISLFTSPTAPLRMSRGGATSTSMQHAAYQTWDGRASLGWQQTCYE